MNLFACGALLVFGGLALIMLFGDRDLTHYNSAERLGMTMIYAGSAAVAVASIIWIGELL